MKTIPYFNRSHDALGAGVRHTSARRDARLILLASLGSCALAGLGQAWGATLEVCPSCTYATLQAAVTAANGNTDSTNTINVGAGTYVEANPFRINSTRTGIANKTLNINGVSAQSTLIKADPATNLTDTGWWYIDSGEILNLSNLTLDGNYPGGARLAAGLVFAGKGVIDGIHLMNICLDRKLVSGNTLLQGSGIVQDYENTTAAMTLTVQNSRIDNFCDIAVGISGRQSYTSTVTVQNNRITCGGQPPTGTLWVQTGIFIGGSTTATIKGNTIANCYGVIDCFYESDYYDCPDTPPSTPDLYYDESSGLYVTTLSAGTSVTATNNRLVNNYDGILLEFYDYNRGAWIFNYNSLPNGTAPNGKAEIGLLYLGDMRASSTSPVNAKNNWWGQTTSPWDDDLIRNYGADYDPLYEPWISAFVGDGTRYGQPGFWPILPGDSRYPTTCNTAPLNLANLSFPAGVGAFNFASNTNIATSGAVILEAGANVILRSPRHSFQPGFRVIKGAYLEVVAGAGGC